MTQFKIGDRVKVAGLDRVYVIRGVGEIWNLDMYIFRLSFEETEEVLEEYFLESQLIKI